MLCYLKRNFFFLRNSRLNYLKIKIYMLNLNWTIIELKLTTDKNWIRINLYTLVKLCWKQIYRILDQFLILTKRVGDVKILRVAMLPSAWCFFFVNKKFVEKHWCFDNKFSFFDNEEAFISITASFISLNTSHSLLHKTLLVTETKISSENNLDKTDVTVVIQFILEQSMLANKSLS